MNKNNIKKTHYTKGNLYSNKGTYLGTRIIYLSSNKSKTVQHIFSTGVYDGSGAVILFKELV